MNKEKEKFSYGELCRITDIGPYDSRYPEKKLLINRIVVFESYESLRIGEDGPGNVFNNGFISCSIRITEDIPAIMTFNFNVLFAQVKLEKF